MIEPALRTPLVPGGTSDCNSAVRYRNMNVQVRSLRVTNGFRPLAAATYIPLAVRPIVLAISTQ
jgi:hypothetical protein